MIVTVPGSAVAAGASQGGMRERKRRATRSAIQRAVLRLALERGFDKVTVEEVSQAAGVSPRTFFNYFPTKEAAVIGDVPVMPVGEVAERFVRAAPQPVLDGVRDLLLTTVDDLHDPDDGEIEILRRRLLREHPSLFTVRMANMRQLEADLSELVERRLVRDDPGLVDDPDLLRSRARLITYVAFAGIRHAWSCWAESGGSGALAERLTASFDELHDVVGGAPGIR